MSNITDSGDSGRYIQELRDRAATVRRISRELSDDEAAKSLAKHAQDLEREAKQLEDRTPHF